MEKLEIYHSVKGEKTIELSFVIDSCFPLFEIELVSWSLMHARKMQKVHQMHKIARMLSSSDGSLHRKPIERLRDDRSQLFR